MSGFTIVPRKKERLGDQLYGQILEQIVSGVLREGERLPSENQICRAFQVSRPVVREALMRLQADGLVVSRQGSGTFVQHRPPEALIRFAQGAEIADMLRSLEVRIALEGQAAGLAAIRRTPQQLGEISQALVRIRTSFEAGEVPVAADLGFHQAVARASGNDIFANILTMLSRTIEHSMRVALSITREGSKDRARRVADEHQAIHDAIADGDAQAADLSMRYHLNRSRLRVTDGQRDV